MGFLASELLVCIALNSAISAPLIGSALPHYYMVSNDTYFCTKSMPAKDVKTGHKGLMSEWEVATRCEGTLIIISRLSN